MEELDVAIIMAHSPQAKGRRGTGERNSARPAGKGSSTGEDQHLGSANRFLQEKFLPAFNRRFVRKAAKPATFTGACRVGWIWTACCRSGRRGVVQNDWTLRFENRWFQLAKRIRSWPWRAAR